MRLPNGKDARNDFVNVKVADDGKGVIKIYLDDILYVTFTLSYGKGAVRRYKNSSILYQTES